MHERKEIIYDLPLMRQEESHDCVQASAAQILAFYNIPKTIPEIKDEVSVTLDASGKPIGSSLGHLAMYFMDLGFTVTVHTSDVLLFDQTWESLSPAALAQQLRARVPFIKHGTYTAHIHMATADGFAGFLEKGGAIAFPVVTEQFIYGLLEQGPIYAAVNYQYMFRKPKYSYNEKAHDLESDPLKGNANTHAVIVAGYKDGKLLIIDPAAKVDGGRPWVDIGRFIGAYYLADIDLDSVLITLKKKK